MKTTQKIFKFHCSCKSSLVRDAEPVVTIEAKIFYICRFLNILPLDLLASHFSTPWQWDSSERGSLSAYNTTRSFPIPLLFSIAYIWHIFISFTNIFPFQRPLRPRQNVVADRDKKKEEGAVKMKSAEIAPKRDEQKPVEINLLLTIFSLFFTFSDAWTCGNRSRQGTSKGRGRISILRHTKIKAEG